MYRKKIVLLSAIYIVTGCQSEYHRQAKVESDTPLQRYNHKLSLQMKHRHQLSRYAKIGSREAKEIARAVCKEEILTERLKHTGQLLYYDVFTKTCFVRINASDGNVMRKERL